MQTVTFAIARVLLLLSAVACAQPSPVSGQSHVSLPAQKIASAHNEDAVSLSAGSALSAALSKTALPQAAAPTLGICIITADFWGVLKTPQDNGRGVRSPLKGGGGTATAYHLLASLLKQQPGAKVTFLGATKDVDVCALAQKVSLHPVTPKFILEVPKKLMLRSAPCDGLHRLMSCMMGSSLPYRYHQGGILRHDCAGAQGWRPGL